MRGERFEAVQVRLSPPAARAILGASPAESGGAVLALDDLWGREAERVRERLAGAPSWEERFALVEAVLARRGEAAEPVDPEVARAWERILAARGLVRVEDLAAEVGWSRRRLWSRFRSQIGLPPKRAARLVRFDRAAHRLAAGEEAARVAAEGGYSDQSHLHRDVAEFTGATPAAVAGEPFLAVDGIAWSGR
ncbi:helix-turn-helix domain-containing protein [Nocardiopsis composta]